MSDPNDDLGSVADSGVPDDPEPGDRGEDDPRQGPGAATDSPASQGSPVGPPD